MLDDEYYMESHRSDERLDLLNLDQWLRRIRKHPNYYRDACLVEFDKPEVPVSLDLHGFDTMAASQGLNAFVDIVRKYRIRRFGIIYGNGRILRKTVHEILSVARDCVELRALSAEGSAVFSHVSRHA